MESSGNEEELYFKIKEDSNAQDRSLGTNQSVRSGSTFSLPGYQQQQEFFRGGFEHTNLGWRHYAASPKSFTAGRSGAALISLDDSLFVNKISEDGASGEEEEEHKGTAGKMRHSSSQALLPCTPLMIAPRRFNGVGPHINPALQGSDPDDKINSSIHFTMEDNSGEVELLSSMNASRGFVHTSSTLQ